MYAGHLGWLHSTPDKSTQNRFTSIGADSQLNNMPDCDRATLRKWNECGCAIIDSSGVSPLTFLEIESYKAAMGSSVSSIDAQALKLMSNAYCVWLVKGRKIDCHAPYFKDTRTQEQKNKEVADKLRAMAKKRRKS